MQFSFFRILCLSLIAMHCLLDTYLGVTAASPLLTVTSLGANIHGNTEWQIDISPDAALFSHTPQGLGGSVATELALEVTGSDLVAATLNNADWPITINGNNPFTSTVTSGLSLDLASNTIFTSMLSSFFLNNSAVELMTIETSGTSCTTLSWGGHTLLSGTPEEYVGSVIAQAGQNFTGYQGQLLSTSHDGDFDYDCDVDGKDLLDWQSGFGGAYNGGNFSDWEISFGTPSPSLIEIIAVPEPNSCILQLLGIICLGSWPRQRLLLSS